MGGFAAGGGIGSALGTVANLFSSKMLMKYQYKLNRKLRRRGYQDTMFSMREAGLNPILAYRQGAVSTGGVGLGKTPAFDAGAVSQGAQADAAQKQAASAKSLRVMQSRSAAAQAVAATSQAELYRAQTVGVNFENTAKSLMAEWYQTPAGETALHGKGIGGIWGPPAAAAEQVFQHLRDPKNRPKISFPGKINWRQAYENRRKGRDQYKKYEGFKYRDRSKGGNVYR